MTMTLATSQMRAVLSADAVTMRDPSGLKAAEKNVQLSRSPRASRHAEETRPRTVGVVADTLRLVRPRPC
jgi:hypothetical protein